MKPIRTILTSIVVFELFATLLWLITDDTVFFIAMGITSVFVALLQIWQQKKEASKQ